MSKNIWIVNEHLTTPEISSSGHSRHYSLGLEFDKHGYDTTLITSSFSHNPYREVAFKGFYKLYQGNIRTLVFKGLTYSKTNSPWRVGNWVLFYILFYLAPLTKTPKPDVIILSSTPMLPVYNILFFKLIYPKCKFIFETRDLWPLTPLSLGNYSERNLFIRALSHLERLCYSKADYIVSVLNNSDKHAEKVLGGKKFKFKWISNGIDLNQFGNRQMNKDWGFLRKIDKKKSFLVGYAGTLGNANAMEYIIETFNKYFNGSQFYLAIIGDGGEREFLGLVAKDNPNIFFIDTVSRDLLLSFYQKCDVLYLSSRKRKIYEYGVSANKIFEYMFAKKPILMSGDFPDSIIELSNCGFMVEPENSEIIRDRILFLKGLSNQEKEELGENGFSYLINNLTYSKLAKDYVEIFKELQIS